MALTGGCQCGAVRYRLDAAPTGANICHCRMCQKAGGGPFMAFAGVKPADMTWTRGSPETFASSDIAERGFCAGCGTPLTYQALGADRIGVTIGSLDDPGEVAPVKQFGAESQLPWLATIFDLPMSAHAAALRPEFPLVSHQYPDHDD